MTNTSSRSPTVLRLMRGAAFGALCAAVAQPALAQESKSKKADKDATVSEVVVTGTLIRGIAPVGAQTLSVDEAQIQATGAVDTNQVLATLPVITNLFNGTAVNGNSGNSIVRPNIRGIGAAGGNTTLVLIDGHNAVGAGILQTTPDSGVIPPGMLQRIEVMPDGASSLYGADAVGGIVNFITRRKADGLEVDATYGATSDGFNNHSLNLTHGVSWDTGSFLISGYTRGNGHLPVFKRDLPRQDLTAFGGSDFRGTTCPLPNVTAAGVVYGLPGRQAGVANKCDTGLFSDIVPQEQQNTVFAALTQELRDNLSLDVSGYYSDRLTKSNNTQLSATVSVNNTNPYFQSIAGETSQSVAFSYLPVLGPTLGTRLELQSYGVTPQLTWKVGSDWQVKALYNYGSSTTEQRALSLNAAEQSAAAAGTTVATALNPYNVAGTNSAVLARIFSGTNHSHGDQTLNDARVIADGPIFSLPGGQVRLAVGAEVQRQTLSLTQYNGPAALEGQAGGASFFASGPNLKSSRDLKSVFGELVVPLVGPDNALPFVRGFRVDVSARYDDYSDFGSTTNPKIGFTWDVVDGVSVRGNYGTSFNAPSLADSRSPIVLVGPFPSVALLGTFPGPANLFRNLFVLVGGDPNLKPQTADTYSIGVDFAPPQVPGLRFGATYWNVKLDDAINVGAPGFPGSLFSVPAFQPTFLLVNPTLAQLQAAIPPGSKGAIDLAPFYANGQSPYGLLQLRRTNVGFLHVDGVDFNASYNRDFGSVTGFANVAGTWFMHRTNGFKGAFENNLLAANRTRLQVQGQVGAKVGGFTASAQVFYVKGYTVTGAGTQTHLDNYHPMNLAFAYDFGPDQNYALRNLSVTLNVNNVFDDYPPFLNVSGGGAATASGLNPDVGSIGQTIGRLVEVGIHKRF